MPRFRSCGPRNAAQRALGEVAVLPLPYVSIASPRGCSPYVSALGLLVSRDHQHDPALSSAGAVWATLVIVRRRRSEPKLAPRALPLDHAGRWFPFLRVDGACGRVVQRLFAQWRLLLVAMKYRPVNRRLVQCPALLQQQSRIGQGHVRGNCLDRVLVDVQNQESQADFRTDRRRVFQCAAGGPGTV